MRFESRHRDIKTCAVLIASKVNLLKTIAIKQMLKMCQALDSLFHEERISFGPIEKQTQSDQDNYQRVTIDGIVYNIGTFLFTNLQENEVEFGKITRIRNLSNTDESSPQVQFYIEVYRESYFDFHTHSYIIKRDAAKERELNCSELIPNSVVHSIVCKEKHHIVTRYRL